MKRIVRILTIGRDAPVGRNELRPYIILNPKNPVSMVGHEDECVQRNRRESFWQFFPAKFDDSSYFIWDQDPVPDVPKEVLFAMSADGYEIRPISSVIVVK